MKSLNRISSAASRAARIVAKLIATSTSAMRYVPDVIKGVHLLPLYNCATAICSAHNHTIVEIWRTTNMHWWIALIILVEVCVELTIDHEA